ncbi:nitrite reductase small subunit NirD [Pleionea sp. CnH1-48]|uniref:nitrite reductase small subunit NirD n=1 Tax=Pleionea sp. CnH1-48 TaxID=2954494 RepID=UPI002097FCF8|nr:nitrite reductase small subunit NirD [Pleionea sp. CnH1-48]MCO7227458.1 nitrite reductase small subunit NirD [Pleionea sp. CnH1-48]
MIESHLLAWQKTCRVKDIIPDTGVAALIEGEQIAVFRTSSDQVYAINNHDPSCRSNVLARGIVGSFGKELVVASPISRQHFSLTSGKCIEEKILSVKSYQTKVDKGWIFVALNKELNS